MISQAGKIMHFIDPHIHIASRTTDDLQAMANAGCLVVGEPAFWMGYDRSSAGSFYDYFRQLTEWEPKRTANYGVQHYAWMGINAKEAEDVGFARDVIAILPEFLKRPNVLGIGEIELGVQWTRTLPNGTDLLVRGTYEGQLWSDSGTPTLGYLGFEGFGAQIGFAR